MKKIYILIILSFIFVGKWNFKNVYVDPDNVSGLMWLPVYSGTKIILNKGSVVYTDCKPKEVYNALENANRRKK